MAWIKIQENNAEFFCIAAVGIAAGLLGLKKYNEAEKELHAAIDCTPVEGTLKGFLKGLSQTSSNNLISDTHCS